MHPKRRSAPPLDTASLERLALRYVERFATTRGKLVAYLKGKIRERGWEGPPGDPVTIAQRFAELGYIDDRNYAESKASAMARRGLGARRVADALRQAGVEEVDARSLDDDIMARAGDAALTFARKRGIGPFSTHPTDDRALLAKQAAAMIRAGHSPDLVWRIVRMPPQENVDFVQIDD